MNKKIINDCSDGNINSNLTGLMESKILVAYYSASGNTKKVAKEIAEILNADLFEIIPKDIYTNEDLDWTNSKSRVNSEHDDERLRNIELITPTVEKLASYNTVLIGYPIWWEIAAWPVNNFVKNNNFAGKTVIPFCTASSSGIGQSGVILKKMAESENWKQGTRFYENASLSDIKAWIDILNL